MWCQRDPFEVMDEHPQFCYLCACVSPYMPTSDIASFMLNHLLRLSAALQKAQEGARGHVFTVGYTARAAFATLLGKGAEKHIGEQRLAHGTREPALRGLLACYQLRQDRDAVEGVGLHALRQVTRRVDDNPQG